jgi:tRNA pseudouridine55 synthase
MSDKNILLVDKPRGITSFDVIRILRKKLNIRKMGHAGTLDPLASGLMIIGINDGTKKMSEFLKLPKTYVADILLGKKSETGDMEGKIIEEKSSEHITDEAICKVVENFSGKHHLAVPMYSAIKVGGRPLYSIARKKEEGKKLTEKEIATVPPKKEMEVLSIKLLSVIPALSRNDIKIKVEMRVSSGSYIRTLAEELGNHLGMPAMLTDLRRTEIGEYSVKDAMLLS